MFFWKKHLYSIDWVRIFRHTKSTKTSSQRFKRCRDDLECVSHLWTPLRLLKITSKRPSADSNAETRFCWNMHFALSGTNSLFLHLVNTQKQLKTLRMTQTCFVHIVVVQNYRQTFKCCFKYVFLEKSLFLRHLVSIFVSKCTTIRCSWHPKHRRNNLGCIRHVLTTLWYLRITAKRSSASNTAWNLLNRCFLTYQHFGP